MVAIFVLVASALAVPAVVAAPETSPNHLFARQLTGFDPSQIPSSCLTTQCQSFINSIESGSCTTLECLCTTNVVNALKSCDQCAIDANAVTQANINTAMQEYAQGCSAAGFPISGLSTSGGSSSAAASESSAATGTKAASDAASTATTAASSGSSGSSSSTTGSSKSGASMLTAGVLGSFVAIALGALNL